MNHTRQITQVFDVGGTAIKYALCDDEGNLSRVKTVPSEYPMTPRKLAGYVKALLYQDAYPSRVAVGFAGMVRRGVILSAPYFITRSGPGSAVDKNLVSEWKNFPLAAQLSTTLSRPTRVSNDADLHGLAFIKKTGVEVMIAFGTGVGTAIYSDGQLCPHLELAQYPFHGGVSLNDWASNQVLKDIGAEQWARRASSAVEEIRQLVFADLVYLGGGNSRYLAHLANESTRIVNNIDGMRGGPLIWEQPSQEPCIESSR